MYGQPPPPPPPGMGVQAFQQPNLFGMAAQNIQRQMMPEASFNTMAVNMFKSSIIM